MSDPVIDKALKIQRLLNLPDHAGCRRVCSGGLGLTPAGAIVPSCLADTLNGSAPLGNSMDASDDRIGLSHRAGPRTLVIGNRAGRCQLLHRRADQAQSGPKLSKHDELALV